MKANNIDSFLNGLIAGIILCIGISQIIFMVRS